jgi:hypothetical protein
MNKKQTFYRKNFLGIMLVGGEKHMEEIMNQCNTQFQAENYVNEKKPNIAG